MVKGKVSLSLNTQGGIQNIDTASCYRKANLPEADILSLFLTTLDLNVSPAVLLVAHCDVTKKVDLERETTMSTFAHCCQAVGRTGSLVRVRGVGWGVGEWEEEAEIVGLLVYNACTLLAGKA